MSAADSSNQSSKSEQSSTDAVILVTKDDLPLHCPTADDSPLWSSHPRVFIPVEESGEASCPYCGNRFRLEEK